MSNLNGSFLILFLSVFIASIAQIFLKYSANRSYTSRIREYVNIYVITGYSFMLLSTILTMTALKKVPLSWVPMVESSSYIFVSVLGYWILKERLTKRKIKGLLIILAGIMIFSIGK